MPFDLRSFSFRTVVLDVKSAFFNYKDDQVFAK